MTLSDAIRAGSKRSEQSHGILHSTNWRYACAVGAAFLGMEIHRRWPTWRCSCPEGIIMKFWPWTAEMEACPQCGKKFFRGIPTVIMHLNDFHRWSREAIAEWIATIEPLDVPAPPVMMDEPQREPHEECVRSMCMA
jgi:hypothetical protein